MDRKRPRRTTLETADSPVIPGWSGNSRARIAFFGAGRTAASLGWALLSAGHLVTAVSSRSRTSAERLAARLPGTEVVEPGQLASVADVVLLTVPDSEIASAVRCVPWIPGMAALHCAGSLDLSPLAAASEAGALVGAMHPLQSLTGDLVTLSGVTFAIEAGEPLAGWIRSVVRSIGGRPVDLTPGARTAYHLGAVLVSNFSVALTELASRIWREAGFSRQQAVSALASLLAGTASNLANVGLPNALTGPVARGDVETVGRHLDYLAARHSDFVDLYRFLSETALDLAIERGLNSGLAAELHGRLAKGETDG